MLHHVAISSVRPRLEVSSSVQDYKHQRQVAEAFAVIVRERTRLPYPLTKPPNKSLSLPERYRALRESRGDADGLMLPEKIADTY